MSKDPFDQAAYEEPTPDMLPRTRNGRTDVAGVVAKRRRTAALNLHTNITIERGLAALAQGTSHASNQEALAILVQAEPKYRKLGGKIPFWKDGISKAGHRAGPR